MIFFLFHSLILEVEKWKKKGALEALPFHHFENAKKTQWDFHSCKLTRHSCYERAPQVACLMKEEEGVGFHAQPCCYSLKSTVMEKIVPLYHYLGLNY
jgi:hypothetical protein